MHLRGNFNIIFKEPNMETMKNLTIFALHAIIAVFVILPMFSVFFVVKFIKFTYFTIKHSILGIEMEHPTISTGNL
jgi:hypothetical protein